MKFLAFAPLLLAASVVATQYSICDNCEVMYTEKKGESYGIENGDWCIINEGKCSYTECPKCDAIHVDSDGLFGVNNGDWCYMLFDKCNKQLPVCETCTVYGKYKNVQYGKENEHLCRISEGKCSYTECPKCDAIHVDSDGLFGVNNGDWCYISFDKCNKQIPVCETCNVYSKYKNVKYGKENDRLCKINEDKCSFSECPTCDAFHVDSDGLFGIDGGNWCHMSFDKCNSKIPDCETCTVYGKYKNVQYGKENEHLCKINEIRCSVPPCKNTCEIMYSDENGDFGVENDQWCLIDKKNCKSK